MIVPLYLILIVSSCRTSTHAALLVRQLEADSGNLSLSLQHATNSDASTASITSSGGAIAQVESDVSTNRPADQCWTSWMDYWSKTVSIESKGSTLVSTVSRSAQTVLVSDTKILMPTTVTAGNGNFPTRTFLTTITEEVAVYTVVNTSSVWTYTLGVEGAATITPPPCALPTFVPQCQSSWMHWANNGAEFGYDQPHCTQASIADQVCSNVMSNWLSQQRAGMGEISGKIGLQELPRTVNGTSMYPESTTLYYWPTSSAVAPGCTVGCQSCAVSGSRVKLLYWPPATTGWRNGTFYAATTNVSSRRTMVIDGTTLTSPTVYMSFNRLHASNSCKVIGQTLQNIIVPITNSATLSSLYGWDRYWGLQQTASFNFTDLYVSPVPESIYTSQPRCASSSINIWYYTCLPSGTTGGPTCDAMRSNSYTCTRTLPYEPVLSIPLEVRQLQPEWSTCVGGVIGVYDPPSALHEAASVAVPTMPSAAASTSAQSTLQSDGVPTTPAVPSASPSSPAPITSSLAEPQQTQTGAPAASSGNPAVPSAAAGSQSHSSDTINEVPSAPSSSDIINTSQDTGSVTFSSAVGAPPRQSPQASVILTANDQIVTAAALSNKIVLMDQSSTMTLQPGDTAIVGSQFLSLEESAVFISGSSIPLTPAQVTAADAQPTPIQVWSAEGQAISAIQQGSSIILMNDHSTATLQQGTRTIFASQTIQALISQSLAIDRSTIPISIPSVTPSERIWTASDGTYSVIPIGTEIIFHAPSYLVTLPSTVTVATLGGHAVPILPATLSPFPSPKPTPTLYWTKPNGHKTISAYYTSSGTYSAVILTTAGFYGWIDIVYHPTTTRYMGEQVTVAPNGKTITIGKSVLALASADGDEGVKTTFDWRQGMPWLLSSSSSLPAVVTEGPKTNTKTKTRHASPHPTTREIIANPETGIGATTSTTASGAERAVCNMSGIVLGVTWVVSMTYLIS